MKARIFWDFLLIIVVFVLSCQNQSQENAKRHKQIKLNSLIVSAQDVCMVDNKTIEDTLMLMVEIEGKKYYGCCEPCIEYLLLDSSIRYSLDPFSSKMISKADAFIAQMNPDSSEVLYFETEKNYLSFYDN